MKYPSRGDYGTHVRNIKLFIDDPVLKNGHPVLQNGKNVLKSYNGGKAIVFQIKVPNKKYALKCWVEDLGSLKNRYREIDKYLNAFNHSYFVEFAYNEKGILVNGSNFPIVRMEWVEGLPFKEFISKNISNTNAIKKIAFQFLEMVTFLHQNQVSHGDLQHGNILIRDNGNLCLVDYDTMFVPTLNNEKDNIKGLPGYQHPNRKNLVYLNSKVDYFSEIVIFLTLIVLIEKPSYWKQIEKEERLLFSEKDFCDCQASNTFTELKKMSPAIKYLTEELEKFCRVSSIDNLLPLEKIIDEGKARGINFDIELKTNKGSSAPQEPWSFPKPGGNKPNNVSKDPWNKFEKNQKEESVWDQLGTKKFLFDKPIEKKQTIWSQFKIKISSIWDKIFN